MGMGGQLEKDLQITGATDGTNIGNTGDALHVAVRSAVPTTDLATFTVLSLSTASANNKSLISLTNATGTAVNIKIRSIRVINTQNTAVTGVIADLNVYRCTSHSGGTLLTSLTMDTADVLDSNVTARTGATITGEAANPILHLDLSTDEWGVGTLDTESLDHALQSLLFFYEHKSPAKPLTLRANEGLTLKCITNTATGLFDIQIFYTQEPA